MVGEDADASQNITYWYYRTKGRPTYYATKKEEYAKINFDLDAGMSLSLSLSYIRGSEGADVCESRRIMMLM